MKDIRQYMENDIFFIVIKVIFVYSLLFSLLILFDNCFGRFSDFVLDLCTGYIITFVFFLIIEYYPEKRRKERIEFEYIPQRYAIYREVFQFVYSIMCYFDNIYTRNFSNHKLSFHEQLDSDFYRAAADQIEIFKTIEPELFLDGKPSTWYDYIRWQLLSIKKDGEIILSRYVSLLPTRVFNDIRCLLSNEAYLINLENFIRRNENFKTLIELRGGSIEPHESFYTLGYMLPKSFKGPINDGKWIIDLIEWVNSEEEYLNQYTKENDYFMLNRITYSLIHPEG